MADFKSSSRVLEAAWPACVGTLAVTCAYFGPGAFERRSAIAWMIGSWGARLSVQSLYTRQAGLPLLASDFRSPHAALFFSLPALIVSLNPTPSLSLLEIASSILWVIAFAVETTADRQWIRFAAKPENEGLDCRSGVWRWLPDAHAVCEVAIWTALALFAFASPWGWIAFACPAALIYVQSRRRMTR